VSEVTSSSTEEKAQNTFVGVNEHKIFELQTEEMITIMSRKSIMMIFDKGRGWRKNTKFNAKCNMHLYLNINYEKDANG
jgi:hypothetical protein